MTEQVVEARPAATVVLLRPGPNGLEALLTHRPTTMAFAGGAHVFPGGRVDVADSDPGLAARSVVSAGEAATGLGVTRQQLYRVIRGQSGISPEMALRLEKAIGGTADGWLRMQVNYDLAQIRARSRSIKLKRLEPKVA